MIALDKLDNKFAFVLAAAKRARQLQMGAKPLVPTSAHKPTRAAMDEVFGGAVPFELPPLKDEEEDEKGRRGKSKRASK
ncbi:MAG: DNA-directed RNA polymerase subunit omega [Acidobacteria bacterium]|nr:DNA-directed RNA polymerase subunit omega [Acidobacteriota bacterium]